MGISVKTETAKIEKSFPKLMINRAVKSIVLFKTEGAGTVVDEGNGVYGQGYFTNDWNMKSFDDFEGTITLSNE